jgi:hypothetical protein
MAPLGAKKPHFFGVVLLDVAVLREVLGFLRPSLARRRSNPSDRKEYPETRLLALWLSPSECLCVDT